MVLSDDGDLLRLESSFVHHGPQVFHLFPSSGRQRQHVFHCYELLLLQLVDKDPDFWAKLKREFGHCEECDGGSPTKKQTIPSATGSEMSLFRRCSIPTHLWFLAVVLQECRDKLIYFIRTEMKRENENQVKSPTHTFLASYLSTFNFVELHLDNVFHHDDTLPKELFRCCPNVKSLSLKSNFLERLPADIGRLAKLECLALTNNKLQNNSIPFTLGFCHSLTALYLDDNLLDALPGLLLGIPSLRKVHRHGNHNYFKATFMWYHTDVNERILESPGIPSDESPPPSDTIPKPDTLQTLCAKQIISDRFDFFSCEYLPPRLKDFISDLCGQLNVCGHCPAVKSLAESGFKVFTFKNPYLGNTCVPFLHWACSKACAKEIEIPARLEQISSAREQDIIYERYVLESVSRLRPSSPRQSNGSLHSCVESQQPESMSYSCAIM